MAVWAFRDFVGQAARRVFTGRMTELAGRAHRYRATYQRQCKRGALGRYVRARIERAEREFAVDTHQLDMLAALCAVDAEEAH